MTKTQLIDYFRANEGCRHKADVARKLDMSPQSLNNAPEGLNKYYMDCAIVYFARSGKKVPKEFL